MKKISFALETNIEIIVAEKKNILQDGAEKLTDRKSTRLNSSHRT